VVIEDLLVKRAVKVGHAKITFVRAEANSLASESHFSEGAEVSSEGFRRAKLKVLFH
jgi:hypothetical protein